VAGQPRSGRGEQRERAQAASSRAHAPSMPKLRYPRSLSEVSIPPACPRTVRLRATIASMTSVRVGCSMYWWNAFLKKQQCGASVSKAYAAARRPEGEQLQAQHTKTAIPWAAHCTTRKQRESAADRRGLKAAQQQQQQPQPIAMHAGNHARTGVRARWFHPAAKLEVRAGVNDACSASNSMPLAIYRRKGRGLDPAWFLRALAAVASRSGRAAWGRRRDYGACYGCRAGGGRGGRRRRGRAGGGACTIMSSTRSQKVHFQLSRAKNYYDIDG
jgi:hypothetical protein